MYMITMWTRWCDEVRHVFFKTEQEAIDYMKKDYDETLENVSEAEWNVEWNDFYSDGHTSAIITDGDDSYFWQIDKIPEV